MKKISKKKFTEAIKLELQSKLTNNQALHMNLHNDEIFHSHLWVNSSKISGYRLNYLGAKILSEHLNYEQFKFPLYEVQAEFKPNLNKMLVQMEKYISSPYFFSIKEPIVYIYDSKLSTVIALFGSIERYLRNKSKKYD